MQDSEFLHKLAKGFAKEEGISEEKAIQIIRSGFTLNSELHTKFPQLQSQPYQPYQPPHHSILESTADLFTKGRDQYNTSQAGSLASALEMRKLELEESRLKIEDRRYDAEQKRLDQEQDERRDRFVLEKQEIKIKEDQAKRDHQIELEDRKLEREMTRADQKFSQMLALANISGNGSDGLVKMLENQSTSQREYFNEINTVKDNERKHTDHLRTDLLKIEADRDVELAKLKANSDQNTATAIDALVTKMDDSFQGLMKPSGDDGEDFLDQYNKQIAKVDQFQANLTKAGLNTLKSQGVDVEALKKAHNIATDSEESTLDKIIGVGKDLYEKTIKPGMEEVAKNGSSGGTNAPSGLETAFETPDTEMEDRIRAQQESQDREDQIALEEQTKLERENKALIQQYETVLYNKAMQYGIPTTGISLKELESTINQYETIMGTLFNSAPQTKSIIGLRNMAAELKINTAGKTVAQVESEVVHAQQMIEQQLDKLPDNTGPDYVHAPEPTPLSAQEPDPEPPAQDKESTTEQSPPPTPESEYVGDPSLEQIIDHNTDTSRSSNYKRSITAQHKVPDDKNTPKKQDLKKFTLSDGTVIEAKTPLSAATGLAKKLGGTADTPEIVELTDEDGKKFVYETRVGQIRRRGKIIDMPRAKKIN